MRSSLKVSEQDIFFFVFCRSRLTVAQISFIRQHKFFFREINFYLELKKSFHKKIDKKLKLRLLKHFNVD